MVNTNAIVGREQRSRMQHLPGGGRHSHRVGRSRPAEAGRMRIVGRPWPRWVETACGRRDSIVRGNGNKHGLRFNDEWREGASII